jgi:hypothetical protein
MEDELQRLAAMLDRFAAFLRQHGETKWSDWVAGDADRARSGDYDGVEHFLAAFGGVGSINDLIFPVAGGIAYKALGEARDELAEPAYALAKDMQRRSATSGLQP